MRKIKAIYAKGGKTIGDEDEPYLHPDYYKENLNDIPSDLENSYDRPKPPVSPVAGLGKPVSQRLNLNSAVPYASNFVNAFRKLPMPYEPQQETYISPSLVNYSGARANAAAELGNYNRETDYKVAQHTLAQGLKAKALAGSIANLNNLAMQEGNTNAFIKNQTNQFNQGIQARNLQRIQDYNDSLLSRSLKQQELNSENIANLSDKYQMQQRDKNLYELEQRKLGIIPKFYDTGVYGRQLTPEHEAALKSLMNRGYEDGGYIEDGSTTPLAADEPYDPKKRLRIITERDNKRDSVRRQLNLKFNNDFDKVNRGMLDYYQTEPKEYKTVSLRGGMKYSSGGTIHINPANKGKFNALKARTGKSTEELTHSSNPLTRKRAIFAQNARKWHHKLGGKLQDDGDDIPLYEKGGEINFFQNGSIGGMYPVKMVSGGGLSRSSDYGSSSHPYPSVKSGDFAGGGRSYPIPTIHDAVDALKLAHLHNRGDVVSKVYSKYPSLRKRLGGAI